VYLTASSDNLATQLSNDLSSLHAIKAVPCRADITTADGVNAVISICRETMPLNPETGSLQIDILVHSAGLFHAAPLEGCTLEDFQKVYSINVWGPINLTQAVKPYLPSDRSGRIVGFLPFATRSIMPP
jgi:NAD(P)-dependent dehydrogenase (short-subunit alcohol dehydrogenase family)